MHAFIYDVFEHMAEFPFVSPAATFCSTSSCVDFASDKSKSPVDSKSRVDSIFNLLLIIVSFAMERRAKVSVTNPPSPMACLNLKLDVENPETMFSEFVALHMKLALHRWALDGRSSLPPYGHGYLRKPKAANLFSMGEPKIDLPPDNKLKMLWANTDDHKKEKWKFDEYIPTWLANPKTDQYKQGNLT